MFAPFVDHAALLPLAVFFLMPLGLPPSLPFARELRAFLRDVALLLRFFALPLRRCPSPRVIH